MQQQKTWGRASVTWLEHSEVVYINGKEWLQQVGENPWRLPRRDAEKVARLLGGSPLNRSPSDIQSIIGLLRYTPFLSGVNVSSLRQIFASATHVEIKEGTTVC